MRYVFDVNGNNVTPNVQASLLSSTVLPIADLFWLQYINPNDAAVGAALKVSSLYMTNAPWPVYVNKLQNQPGQSGVTTINSTFKPSRIARGSFDYEIGLQDQSCEVTWYTDDTQYFTPGAGRSLIPFGFKWAMVAGYLDDVPMNIYKAYFSPSSTPNGYPTLLGTTLMWRGFIRGCKADRGQVIITLSSLLHVFQSIQIPSQTIQPGARVPPFMASAGVQNFGASLGVTVLSTSTPTDLQFTWPGGSGTYADHALRDCYFTAHQQPPPNGWTAASQQPGPAMYRIRDNLLIAGVEHVYPYEPINPVYLIANPDNGTHFLEIFFQISPNLSGGAPGFPYIPPPEVAF